MIVLGIDPGIATTGWAVVKGDSKRQELLGYGAVLTSKNKDQSNRLEEIYDNIITLIKKYQPQAISIEKLFFNKNLKTALIVGQTHGVVRLAGQKNKIKTVEYTPLEVKMIITGYGRAEKKQIQYMIKQLLKIENNVKQDDTADAIAVALTHCYNVKT